MSESALLSELMCYGFELSGQRVPLGFDVNTIRATIDKLGNRSLPELTALFRSTWPSTRYWLGGVELLGPEDINYEHEKLLPGSLIVQYGFLAIGTNGCGDMFSYAIDDRSVYLISHESVTENSIFSARGEVAPSAPTIRGIAVEKWDSISAFLKWTLDELRSVAQRGTLGIYGKEWKEPVEGIVGRCA